MEEIRYWDCVREVWTDARQFVLRRTDLVVTVLAILLAANIASVMLTQSQDLATPTSLSRLMLSVIGLARSAVVIVLGIQVMRQMVLGEGESRTQSYLGREFWRYVRLSFVLGLIFGVVTLVVVGGGALALHAGGFRHLAMWFPLIVLGLIISCFAIFAGTRLSLLFCHVALGRTARWRASWNDTRDRFWQIGLSHFLTGLPIDALAIVIWATAHFAFKVTQADATAYLFAVGQALFIVISSILGAACSAWLYRRLANTLIEHA